MTADCVCSTVCVLFVFNCFFGMEMPLSPSIFVPLPLYVFLFFRMVFFYLARPRAGFLTSGYVRNQPINQPMYRQKALLLLLKEIRNKPPANSLISPLPQAHPYTLQQTHTARVLFKSNILHIIFCRTWYVLSREYPDMFAAPPHHSTITQHCGVRTLTYSISYW